MSDRIELQQIIGQVAAAYFNNNHVTPSEIPGVIGNIATSIAAVGGEPAAAAETPSQEPEQPKLTPSQIRKSITQDKLISFEDGKGYKTLRRHLAAKGMTPDDYRNKWGLPKDYPMVSPAYSETRSSMAKARGFGSRSGRSAAAGPAVAAERAQRVSTRKKAGAAGGKTRARRRAATAKPSEPTT